MSAKKKKKHNPNISKQSKNTAAKPHNSGFKLFTRIGALVLVAALIIGMLAMYAF